MANFRVLFVIGALCFISALAGTSAQTNNKNTSPEVVFMGASIIEWWPKNGVFFPGKNYLDKGIAGQTSSQVLKRFVPDVFNHQPKAVVILVGANDIITNVSLNTMTENIKSMVKLAHQHGIHVILSSLPPVCGSKVWMRPKMLAYNSWLKNYAKDNQANYIDFYSALVDKNQLLPRDKTIDCLHPNKAGYAIMSPLAEIAIQKALKN